MSRFLKKSQDFWKSCDFWISGAPHPHAPGSGSSAQVSGVGASGVGYDGGWCRVGCAVVFPRGQKSEDFQNSVISYDFSKSSDFCSKKWANWVGSFFGSGARPILGVHATAASGKHLATFRRSESGERKSEDFLGNQRISWKSYDFSNPAPLGSKKWSKWIGSFFCHGSWTAQKTPANLRL